MKTTFSSRPFKSFSLVLSATLTIVASLSAIAPLHAQTPTPLTPIVPTQYAALYTLMESDLDSFADTIKVGWNGSKPPMQLAGELHPATSISAPPSYYLQRTIIPYINALQALGIKTVKFSINFPVLYQPYYNSSTGANNPSGYQQTLNFYQEVVAELRQRGMKIVIPTQVTFPFEYPTITPYLRSLTFAQYCTGRSVQAQTIASLLKPDYLMIQSEPVTEVENTPPNISVPLSNLSTDLALVTGILNDLKKAGLRSPNLFVGAGMGTWQPDFDNYLAAFVNLPMDILDVHVYPINNLTAGKQTVAFLPRILQMADAAHSHGLRIGMGECWVNKATNSELSQGAYSPLIPSRNVYGFWSPIDEQFLECMAAAGYWKRFDFIAPSETFYFFANLDYNQMQPVINGMNPTQAANTLLQYENKAAAAAVSAGNTTDVGKFWADLIKDGVTPGQMP